MKKYKHYMQHDRNDCGRAVVQTILAQNKIIINSYTAVLKNTDPTNFGYSLYDMKKEIESWNGISDIYEVDDINQIPENVYPFIAVIKKNELLHYMVCILRKKNTLIISDPEYPEIQKIDIDEFSENFENFILTAEFNEKKFFRKKKKNSDPSEVDTKKILQNIPIKNKIFLIFIYFLRFLIPIGFYLIMQKILANNFENLNNGWEFIFFSFFIFYCINNAYITISEKFLYTKIENNIQKNFLSSFFKSELNNSKEKKYNENNIDYLWNLLESTESILQIYFLRVNSICLLFLFLLLLIISPQFFIVFTTLFLIAVLIAKFFSKSLIYKKRYLITNGNHLFTTFDEYIKAKEDIKDYRLEKKAQQSISSTFKNFFQAKIKFSIIESEINALINFMGDSMLVLTLIISYIYYLNEVSIITLTSGMYVFMIMITLFQSTLSNWITYNLGVESAKHINIIKNIDNSLSSNNYTNIDEGNINNYELKNLSFSYEENKNIIINKNFAFVSGTIYGIKGNNGSGKTTLAKIMIGKLTPNNGEIILNKNKTYKTLIDTDITQYVSYFSSNQHIFTGGLQQNIEMSVFNHEDTLYTSSNSLTDDLPPFILSEGKYLSNGERIRILISRCLNKNADIYIFDEPSDNLDSHSISILHDELKKLKKLNKIIIIISHDSELLSKCEVIYDL